MKGYPYQYDRLPGRGVGEVTMQATPQVTPQVEKLLLTCEGEMTKNQLMKALKVHQFFLEKNDQVSLCHLSAWLKFDKCFDHLAIHLIFHADHR